MPLVTIQGEYGPQEMWQNADGSYWKYNNELPSYDAANVRPDLLAQRNQEGLTTIADSYKKYGFQQFTPEQVQAYLANGQKPIGDRVNPAFGPNLGIYNDSMYGGNNLWYGPQQGPQHNDTGPEQAQTAWNDMRNGLAIMALPFAVAGGAALVGGEAAGAGAAGAGAAEAGGAGAAGAGAAEGGAAAAGASGLDASTGLYAGEAATSGSAGAGAYGGGVSAGGSNMLVANAGGTADVSPGLQGSSMGEEGFDPNLLQDPSYWNPEGGTTGLAEPGATGIDPGTSTYSGGIDWEGLAKQYGPSILKTLPALLGAAAGRFGGGAKPAGNTVTTQDLPAWLKPYAQSNVGLGADTLSKINPFSPVLAASQNEAMKTINGDYLNPNSNPYFASSVNDALGLAKSQFAGMYGGPAGANINNSGFQEGLTRTLGQLATNAYSQNYQNERGRQATAAFGAPAFASQSAAAPFAGNQAFAGLFPNVSSTTVPYFNNPMGNMFSGALGGAALGKAFG